MGEGSHFSHKNNRTGHFGGGETPGVEENICEETPHGGGITNKTS